MYLLWYAPEIQSYKLDFSENVHIFEKSNHLDVLYTFSIEEKKIAQKVLNNLNLIRSAA